MPQLVVCTESELERDGKLVVDVEGTAVLVVKVGDALYAMRDRCPHNGAPLQFGRVGGTLVPSNPNEHIYGLDGRIIRCPWHKWEYDLEGGCSLTDRRIRLRMFPVQVKDGEVLLEV